MAKRGKRAQICAVLMAAAVSMTSVPALTSTHRQACGVVFGQP